MERSPTKPVPPPVGAQSASANELEYAVRLERGMVRVRWFGVLLGGYLVVQTNNTPVPPYASRGLLAFAFSLIVLLAVGNVLIILAMRRNLSVEGFKRLGFAAFALDAVVLYGLAWAYSFDPRGSTWVVMYILPLEGALRYQLRGALAVVAVSFVNEVARETYMALRFTEARPNDFLPRYGFEVGRIAFRVGMLALIASITGFMARSLAQQRDKAARQATLFEEVAQREAAASRELAAFNTVILAGVAAEDLGAAAQLMAEAIGRDLGFESLTIMVREGDELRVMGMYGMPFYDRLVPIGKGVTGTAALRGHPIKVGDVTKFPGYIEVDPQMRSELAVPMKIGDEIVGVVDVESRTPNAFDDRAMDLLARLADQIALVVHSNQLLSQQRETMTRLRELDQMKSDFIAITSHELRTPITAIRGFVKTLIRNRERLSGDQIANFMQIIDRQSERLARLVEDLLFVSKIEAGTIRLSVEEVHLSKFLKEVVDALGPERRSRVWLDVHEDGAVVIDPQRLDQVLRNLIENALKFSPADSTVFVEGGLSDGRLDLSVADQGVGIKPEDIPRIFDRFHQAGHALTREAEGAGLGLYITKRLVDAMGGNISVTSAPGEGATFRVSLPARPPVDAETSVATFMEGAAPTRARGPEATASGVRPSTS